MKTNSTGIHRVNASASSTNTHAISLRSVWKMSLCASGSPRRSRKTRSTARWPSVVLALSRALVLYFCRFAWNAEPGMADVMECKRIRSVSMSMTRRSRQLVDQRSFSSSARTRHPAPSEKSSALTPPKYRCAAATTASQSSNSAQVPYTGAPLSSVSTNLPLPFSTAFKGSVLKRPSYLQNRPHTSSVVTNTSTTRSANSTERKRTKPGLPKSKQRTLTTSTESKTHQRSSSECGCTSHLPTPCGCQPWMPLRRALMWLCVRSASRPRCSWALSACPRSTWCAVLRTLSKWLAAAACWDFAGQLL
mmetsp:Transcript_43581/g.112602  ORF Transcript_43581/g.112602 Transcript_43581/m.112602 type:complete len:306 (+) Transcript_43581:1888-2805(+)